MESKGKLETRGVEPVPEDEKYTDTEILVPVKIRHPRVLCFHQRAATVKAHGRDFDINSGCGYGSSDALFVTVDDKTYVLRMEDFWSAIQEAVLE